MSHKPPNITINPGGKDYITISGNRNGPSRPYNGPPAPNPGTTRTRRARGPIRNQFNITGSTIGAMAIGNTGTTILNQKNQTFGEGARNVEFDIKGGNFNQANLGEKADYKNIQSSISSKGGSGTATGGEEGLKKGSIEQDLDSDMVAEKRLIEVLKKNVPVSDIKKLLEKGLKIIDIWKAVKSQGTDAAVSRMVQSMLRS